MLFKEIFGACCDSHKKHLKVRREMQSS